MKMRHILAVTLPGLLFLAPPAYARAGYDVPNGDLFSPILVTAPEAWAIVGILAFLLAAAALVEWFIKMGQSAQVFGKVPVTSGYTQKGRMEKRLIEIIGLPPGTTLIEGRYPYLLIPGKRCRRYLDRRVTPLTLHRVVWYVGIPWRILISIMRIGLAFFDTPNFREHYRSEADPVAGFVNLIFLSITLVSFIRWHRLGLWCFLSLIWSSVAWSAAFLIFKIISGAPDLDDAFFFAILYIVLYSIVALPVTIYYIKRALLFSSRYPQIEEALRQP